MFDTWIGIYKFTTLGVLKSSCNIEDNYFRILDKVKYGKGIIWGCYNLVPPVDLDQYYWLYEFLRFLLVVSEKFVDWLESGSGRA